MSSPRSDQSIIGTVDDQWRLDRVSNEVKAVLGYQPADLAGIQPLTGVSPHDLPQVLSGLAHVHATGRTSVVRTRVRRHDGSWTWCRAQLSAMGDAPRFAFTLRALTSHRTPDADSLGALERKLAGIAQDIRTVAFPAGSVEAPVLADIPELANLTSREWQTLSLFATGGRVAAIAAELGLSQSTVRNHLSSIFGKLDVTSQAELFARLRPTR
jgi:PAS domain S-box-containing protein